MYYTAIKTKYQDTEWVDGNGKQAEIIQLTRNLFDKQPYEYALQVGAEDFVFNNADEVRAFGQYLIDFVAKEKENDYADTN